ncbi:hypothetical protein [Streptomyces sp. SID161]|uniref:hypothetical protein n=1 Tax=Streptomyces sp. SID161 TaxID=2690251 RepID=UPI001367CA7B|nr:hypothetical protein [Streptomyces sp. SID161]MYW46357.1 hypothetical protein [Streptomyces sp. SID161]
MPEPTLSDAREHAIHSWILFVTTCGLTASLPTWTTGTAPDGNPVLSAEVAGPGAAHALSRFASEYHLTLPHPGDARPQFDVEVVDRTVLVWRRDGVWVELWHPNTVPAAPEPAQTAPGPVQATPASAVRAALRGLGDRLPTTRRNKETSRA